MNAERFEQLAQAYGGELMRWPEAERAAARAFAEANEALAGRALAEARRLDTALNAVPAPSASDLLRARILAAAPKPVARLADWMGFGSRRRWAPWAGLAAACAAGVVVGAAAMDRATTGPRADLVLAANEAGGWMDSYANVPEAR